jgi:hypothetical protein
LKTILAPLDDVSMKAQANEERKSLPSLGEGHPEDEDELEGVVEGWRVVSETSTSCRGADGITHGTSRRR